MEQEENTNKAPETEARNTSDDVSSSLDTKETEHADSANEESVEFNGEGGRELIEGGSPVGRKLDFLCQEFNREANTVCSKSSDLNLTRVGLQLKAAIERLREQIQNIE